jgi:hypothetical protein
MIHEKIQNQYPGLPEYSEKHPFLTVQIRHILYPKIDPDFDTLEYTLNGFHHDQYQALEKSGMFTYKNKAYGKAKHNAQKCYKAKVDFGSGIVSSQEKTFFPTSWSSEQVIQTICEAAQNRIEEIIKPEIKNSKKYLCQTKDGFFLDIVINNKNMIISAFPSEKNFK